MKTLTAFEAWYGRNEPPPEVVKLKAGKLELEYEGGDLRYIRYAGRELIRRIYVAIRDKNWNTIPAKITDISINREDDSFHIQFNAYHQDKLINFRWHGTITGDNDGTIVYKMDGLAESEFLYCRIGFCILHPIEGIAGRPYSAKTPPGEITGILPDLIEPQRIDEKGCEVPIFPSCSSITVDTASGVRVITDFKGDLFEMEDQRNWTDGSFKTYCTPISLGYPRTAETGQVIYQEVAIRVDSNINIEEASIAQDASLIELNLGEATNHQLAKYGFGLASGGGDLKPRELTLLSRLRPSHLKVEIHLQEPTWVTDLEKAIAAAKLLISELELVVFLSDYPDDALQILKSKLFGVPVVRVIVFHEAEMSVRSTSSRWMQIVRKYLADASPFTQFIGGTNGNFAEINRQWPDITLMDGVSYPVNPQVHLTDERSLIEAIQGQGDTVVTAKQFCGSLPVVISSVTLKPPFNQAAIEEEAPHDPNELPTNVDPRQMSLFAAAWTVGSIRSLTMAGVDSITYYETTGWRGLIESDYGIQLPDKYLSFQGMIFPVYWVFEFLANEKDAILISLTSDMPLLVEGLAIRKNNNTRVMIANLQPCFQEIRLRSLPEGEASLRRLNAVSIGVASSDPDAFLKLSKPVIIQEGELIHTLDPYETAFLEIHPQS